MSSALDEAIDALQRAIGQVEDERRQLEAALNQLEADGRGRRRGPRPAGRKIARHGQRLQQMLDVLEANPGIKPAEAARRIGITPTHAYGLIRKLRERGELPAQGKEQADAAKGSQAQAS